jgi:DNA-binding transcriptional regulator YbjK
MASVPQAKLDQDVRARIVRATLPFIARGGIRGATLREIAASCGTTAAGILTIFGNKDRLITDSFAEVVRIDGERTTALIAQMAALEIDGALIAPALWGLVEDAWGAYREEALILTELWLAAPGQPELVELCRSWLVARRDAMREVADRLGADRTALDILGLHLFSEACFAVSCGRSTAYRLVAAGGFAEATACLACLGDSALTPAFAALSNRFHADPMSPAKPEGAASRRGNESRERIVDAAAAIIEQEGLASVTNRAVAERAGVSLALTTYHFKMVSELAFAGILRVFGTANAALEEGRQASLAAMVARLEGRANPSGVERLRSRGMAEISLAATRGAAPDDLGEEMRRQRGTLTHAAVRGSPAGGGVSRTRAASHALWSSAVFLIAAAIPDADSIYDFDAQARMAATGLLALS